MEVLGKVSSYVITGYFDNIDFLLIEPDFIQQDFKVFCKHYNLFLHERLGIEMQLALE